jgi:hypothetical protein
LFSIVIENSGLATVHDDSTPRVYKSLIARGYLGFFGTQFLVGFWPPFFSVDPDNLRSLAPAVIVLNP